LFGGVRVVEWVVDIAVEDLILLYEVNFKLGRLDSLDRRYELLEKVIRGVALEVVDLRWI